MQVAGRAGRAKTAGHVILQTHRPEHPLLQSLVNDGYRAFALHALKERQMAQLPPYRYSALVRAESQNDQYNLEFLKLAVHYWADFGDVTADFWGPVHAPMQKRAGFYRTHLLLMSSSRAQLQLQLKPWWQWLQQQPRQSQLRLTLDIDALELS